MDGGAVRVGLWDGGEQGAGFHVGWVVSEVGCVEGEVKGIKGYLRMDSN